MEKYKQAKTLLWDHVIPNMRMLFMVTAPEKYYAWQGNCCRQAAMMTHMVLTYSFGFTQRKSCLVDAEMSAYVNKKFTRWNHTFFNQELYDRNLKVDMSLKQAEPIFEFVPMREIDPSHPHNKSGRSFYPYYSNKLIGSNFHCYYGVKFTDPSSLEDKPEYYTGLTMKQIYEFCIKAKQPTKEILNELRSQRHFSSAT